MDPFYRYTYAEVNLDHIRHNIAQYQQQLPQSVRLMAVLKANAYGHGAERIARVAIDQGVSDLGVAFLDEALALRKVGIDHPILVFGYTAPEHVALAVAANISLTVFTQDVLQAAAACASVERPARIHIKLDTGMGRLGLADPQEAITFIDAALGMPHVQVEALFTHYACADGEDCAYTHKQHERMTAILAHFTARGVHFPCNHAGNSAAGMQHRDRVEGMVRLGISMYGLYPSSQIDHGGMSLRPVMSLKTAVTMVKTLPPGSAISYGSIYHTSGHEKIATLPIGYADGLPRSLSGRIHVLIQGKKVPLVGRICMDQCMINVSEIPDVQIGDEVIVFGHQGDETISVDEWAEKLDTINYELTCGITARVPRIYCSQGQRVAVDNLLFSGGE